MNTILKAVSCRQLTGKNAIVTTVQFYMTYFEHLGLKTVYEEANCCLLKV